MTNSVAGLLPFLAYIVTVAVAVPITIVTLFLARRRLLEPMLTVTLGSVTVFVLLGIGTLAALISVDAGLQALQTAVLTGVAFVVLPLGLGTFLVRRILGGDRDRAMRLVVAGWPVALVLSVVVFIAPGGFRRYNITFLDPPLAYVAVAVWYGIVLLGPTVVGLLVHRVRGPPGGETA